MNDITDAEAIAASRTKFFANEEARIADTAMQIHLAITTKSDAIARILAELITAWERFCSYESTASWSCDELESTCALLEAVGCNEGFVAAFRWSHAEAHEDGYMGVDYDAEILAKYGPRHFGCDSVVDMTTTEAVAAGIITVDLPEQDVQA